MLHNQLQTCRLDDPADLSALCRYAVAMRDEPPLPGQTRENQSLRKRFPEYFSPRNAELQHFYSQGLVALDTNALYEAYRFSVPAREEFFSVLSSLGERLWIPHRVAEEFMRGRLGVISEGERALDKLTASLAKNLKEGSDLLRAFGNRTRLSRQVVDQMLQTLDDAYGGIISQLTKLAKPNPTLDDAIREDEILIRMENLLEGKVGPRLMDEAKEEAEALRRVQNKIPPGFADGGKESARAVGDYFLWAQLKEEARKRKLPVLLVTNDQKEDWVYKENGRVVGPRPELTREMAETARVQFHLVNVRSFLVHAEKYLHTRISPDTIKQAERPYEFETYLNNDQELGTPAQEDAYTHYLLTNLSLTLPYYAIRDEDYDTGERIITLLDNRDPTGAFMFSIVVKFTPHGESLPGPLLERWCKKYGDPNRIVPNLIVTNYAISDAIAQELSAMQSENETTMGVVQWRGQRDNQSLRDEVAALEARVMR